jgi:phage terminase large subunit
VSAEFPSKLRFLFEPSRYKAARGGRGSGKSWGFARALLIQAAAQKLRVLCTREVQNSIKDSVHKLLSDQIQALGLGAHFQVLQNEIRGVNGSEFLFAGLSTQTIESIKSFEGVDRCWVEEGQGVTKRSWTILIPTIRKDASEIWVSFNPDLDDDETYQRFVVNPPPDCVSVEINYTDNPWFPSVLEKEREHAERVMPKDEYQNIWLGKCKSAVDGAIFATEIRDAIENGRICNVPYEAKLKTHAVFDLGWNDQTAIIIVQRHLSELRIIDYIEDSHRTLDWYSAMMRNKMLNWGSVYLPHDAAHGTLNSGGKSSADVMRELKWNVQMVPNIPVETGIKQARMAFNKVYFDKTKAERLVQCLKRYKRNIPVSTGEPASPTHDEYSHGADCFRYLSLVAPAMRNEDWKPIKYPEMGIV